MKNKQTLFGPEEKRKNDASIFPMLTKRSNTKPTHLFLTDAFKNNVLHKIIASTVMKIEQKIT